MLSTPVTPTQSRTLVLLYRSLLRLSKRFDNEPAAKGYIYRTLILPKSDKTPVNSLPFHPFATTKVDPQNVTAYYNEVLDKILEHRFMYLPPTNLSCDVSPQRKSINNSEHFKTITRKEFHEEKDNLSIDERIDAAFAFLRKFSMVWSRHKGLEENDIIGIFEQYQHEYEQQHQDNSKEKIVTADNKEEAVLQQNEREKQINELKSQLMITPSTDLKPGIILAAHPILTGPLHRTVILLLEHTTTASYGIVLNRPTSHILSSAVKNLPQEFVSQFGPCRVSFGGMVRRMQWIHPYGNCGGELIPNCSTPLYAGGIIHRALSFARKNPKKIENFKFFVGCCCWDAGQLEEEIGAGYWITANAQPDRLLALAHFGVDKSPIPKDGLEEKEMTRKFAMGREVLGQVDIYRVMLEALGHDYSKLASVPNWLDSTMIESCDWKA